ncbi:MAG: DUF6431 domain-containing protein [Syntrophomonadaceae bacterium]
MEQLPCPCCSGKLKVIGSRQRKCITASGEKIVLIIRRLRCIECNRIHHGSMAVPDTNLSISSPSPKPQPPSPADRIR